MRVSVIGAFTKTASTKIDAQLNRARSKVALAMRNSNP